MAPQKSPGVDGFPAAFYQNNWEKTAPYFISLVREALSSGNIPEELNRTLIVLIPKVAKPEKVTQFRPISLCNVALKVVSKVLVERIRPLLGDLIDPTQSSFVPGDRQYHCCSGDNPLDEEDDG